MDNIFSSNISQRSAEGNITKKQWSLFKRFCIWCLVAVLISVFIILLVKGIFYLSNMPDDLFYVVKNVINIFVAVFFIIISAVFLFKFFYCTDEAVNNFVKRKVNFYHMVYTLLSEKYFCTREELTKLKILKESFQDKCSLKSYYLIVIGLFSPVILFLSSLLFIVLAGALLNDSLTRDDVIMLFLVVLLMSIILYTALFFIPAKRRMSIWHIVNTNEKIIVDEISRLLISKNIIESPLNFDVNDKFRKPYLALVCICVFMPMVYFVIEIDNANAEKKYLKMIYPVEDKLLEILEY